jgi:acyl dehydratase
MFYFEDIETGTRAEFGSHTFTIEEMLWFAERYDRQPIHLDPEEAGKSLFGGIIASGWLTMAVFMKLFTAYVEETGEKMRAQGKPVVPIGPSPGLEDLKWLKPVKPGDTLTYRATIADKRIFKSRPDRGIVTFDNEAVNQNGEIVLTFRGKGIFERRPQAEA